MTKAWRTIVLYKVVMMMRREKKAGLRTASNQTDSQTLYSRALRFRRRISSMSDRGGVSWTKGTVVVDCDWEVCLVSILGLNGTGHG